MICAFSTASWNILKLPDPHQRAIAIAALIRSCAKRQPRGVFTVAGDPEHYKDDRRDLKLSLREHFLEQVSAYNNAVIDNGQFNSARCGDVFNWHGETPDLVYLAHPMCHALTTTAISSAITSWRACPAIGKA